MRVDVRVYLVSGGVNSGRTLPDVVEAAVTGGATIVQVRDKGGAAGAVRTITEDLRKQLDGAGVPLLVNDDPGLAHEAGAAGVHLGPDDPHPQEARDLLGRSVLVGWSVHTLAQLSDTAALQASDYLAVSPVWGTPTKPDTTAPWGLDGVAELRARMPSHLPLVAIGGIDATNAASVIEAGADGVAVVSAICGAPDPQAAARRLRSVVDAALARRAPG